MNRHTTLNGFKRAAKLLKNERCIPLHKAHEILARKEGYGNYSHAQKVLKSEQIGYKTTFLQNWRIDLGLIKEAASKPQFGLKLIH